VFLCDVIGELKMESRQNGRYIALLEGKVKEVLKKAKENFHTKAQRKKTIALP